MKLDGNDLRWENFTMEELTATHVILVDTREQPTFWERVKMAWKFIWTGKLIMPDRILAMWSLTDE